MSTNLTMKCSLCGRTYDADSWVYRCVRCNYPLEVQYDYGRISSKLSRSSFESARCDIWRYSEMLPIIDTRKIVSMYEGWTPLVRSERLSMELGVRNLFVKDETRNPTCSFKDRGSSVGVSKAISIGAKFVACASTGNMGASLAAYSAKAGIGSVILMTPDTPSSKLAQILVYAPTAIVVKLPYGELYEATLDLGIKHRLYVVQSDTPMRIEGQKTASYEICEQLEWSVPDKVLLPTSSGGNISAYWKGWRELYELGLVDRLPAMVAIQAEGCSPIARAFKTNSENVQPFGSPQTIAHSISNPDPPSGLRVLRLLRESRGFAEVVSDDDMLQAQSLLAKSTGIFAEPAGAASIAGLKKMVENGHVQRDETVVCVVTGSGLKDVESALSKSRRPHEVCSIDELSKID